MQSDQLRKIHTDVSCLPAAPLQLADQFSARRTRRMITSEAEADQIVIRTRLVKEFSDKQFSPNAGGAMNLPLFGG